MSRHTSLIFVVVYIFFLLSRIFIIYIARTVPSSVELTSIVQMPVSSAGASTIHRRRRH